MCYQFIFLLYKLQIARRVGDPNTPRPWSRYSTKKNDLLNGNNESSKNSSLIGSRGQKSASAFVKNLGSSDNNDSKLSEFLQIMQPRSKSKLWANDTTHSMDLFEQDRKSPKKQVNIKKNSSLLQVQFSDESDLAYISSPKIKGSSKFMTDKSLEVAKDDAISDMDYIKSRIKKNWLDSENDDECNEDVDCVSGDDHNDDNSCMDGDDQIFKSKVAQKYVKNIQLDEEKITEEENSIVDNMGSENPAYDDEKRLAFETGRLFVRNLPYTTKYEK